MLVALHRPRHVLLNFPDLTFLQSIYPFTALSGATIPTATMARQRK
jgi:hypothetical protein